MGTIARGAKAGGGTNFNPGQTIASDEVNDDLNTIVTEVNGLLDDANIETATIPGAKSLRFTEIAAPSSPSTDQILLYAFDNGGTTELRTKDSAGNVVSLAFATPRSYLAGLGTAQAADADHDITISAGTCRDSTNAADLTLAASLTKQLDATWAVGTNQGGLDSGSIAGSTWYHIWLIKRTDTGVVDALFSTSATAPTMPANYTLKRRIGSVLTDAGPAIVDYSQNGDEFLWLVPALDVSNDGTEAATSRTLSVPTGVVVMAKVALSASFSAADQSIWLSELDVTDAAPSATASPLATITTGTTNNVGSGGIFIRTNTSAQIRSRTTGTLDGINLNIATLGWLDRRGRDS